MHIFIQEAVNVSFNALNQKDVQNFAFKIFLFKVTCAFEIKINVYGSNWELVLNSKLKLFKNKAAYYVRI